MKEGWEIKKLSELCMSANGLWKGKKGPYITAGVLRSTNFTKDCKLTLEDVAYIEVEEKSFAKRRLQKNDIIVERSGGGPNQPVGRVLLFDIDADNFSFCNFTSALRVIDATLITPQYLHRFLSYFYFSGKTIEMQSNTIGLRNLDYTKYLDINIPFPSILEQKRIVDTLDAEFAKIDALKENVEKNLQNAKDLFQAVLRKELEPKEGWVTASLNELYDVRDGTHDSPKYHPSGYPLVTSKNLRNGIVDLSNVKYISQADYDKINERSKVDVGDVLFAMIGTIGNPSLVTEEPKYAIKNVALFKVRQNHSGALLKYILSNDVILKEMQGKAKGSNQPFVSLGYLRNFKISLPNNLTEEDELIALLDEGWVRCKALQENCEKTIILCNDLKQALLRKAFNGEL